jgi:hypothetical protein
MIVAVLDVLSKSARSNTNLIVLSVVDVTALCVGLSAYLFWAGFLLHRIAGNLEEAADIVSTINGHAELITPAVEHIINTGGIIAGALPLLYNMAEGIVRGVTTKPSPPVAPEDRPPARPASGRRRSRMHDAIGYSG